MSLKSAPLPFYYCGVSLPRFQCGCGDVIQNSRFRPNSAQGRVCSARIRRRITHSAESGLSVSYCDWCGACASVGRQELPVQMHGSQTRCRLDELQTLVSQVNSCTFEESKFPGNRLCSRPNKLLLGPSGAPVVQGVLSDSLHARSIQHVR